MDAELFKREVAVLLKDHGFRKRGTTWWRPQVESIAVFSVQKSRWGGGSYDVSIGTYFRALGSEESPPAHRCHIQSRVAVGDPSAVVQAALDWYDRRVRLEEARLLAESDANKGLVFKEVRHAGVA